MGHRDPSPPPQFAESYYRRVLLTVKVVVLVGLFVALLISAASVFLLLFAAILMAVFLRGCGDWIAERTVLSSGWAVLLVVLALVLIVGGGVSLIIPHAVGEIGMLGTGITGALKELERSLQQSSWGQGLLDYIPDVDDLQGQVGYVVQKTPGIFSTTLGALASLVLVLFIGFYLTASPSTYTRGLVLLFPERRHERVRQILRELQITLTRWLLGRLLGLIVVGIATYIGLLVLGIPLALSLGLLAAFMAFVPNIGPILSVVPAMLLALVEGPQQALWVLVLYSGIQGLESYLLMPLVDKRSVSLPPVLTIVVQILMVAPFGILGLLLAGPMATVLMVLVKMVYVEGVLGTDVTLQGDGVALGDEERSADA
jgi:predicted PurR-regulated permease PerM